MEHEFHSLAEEPLTAKFHGEAVWATREPGVKFVDVPQAPQPAASQAQRALQLRQLAKEFQGVGVFGNNPSQELRLLPQPLYRYAAPQEGVLTGGLFAYVRATDPEIVLLLEARSGSGSPNAQASARWQFAAIRMHSIAELWLVHRKQRVWEAAPLSIREVFEEHERPYTAFKFREIPDFLREPPDRPQPR